MESNINLGAENAIALCSHLTEWDMYCGVALTEGITSLKERLRGSCTEAMEKTKDPERKEIMQQALTEWNHPDFLLWLIKKVAGHCAELEMHDLP